MNEALLLEYVDRRGIVPLHGLSARLGASGEVWSVSAVELIKQRRLFHCRLAQGRETALSLHLYLCLRAVYSDPALSGSAQELYDWLGENELSARRAMLCGTGLGEEELARAVRELQRKLCITPLLAKKRPDGGRSAEREGELEAEYDFLWVTDEHWLNNLHRPQRYRDLSYCVSEVKRYLAGTLSSGEINEILYRGTV